MLEMAIMWTKHSPAANNIPTLVLTHTLGVAILN